MDFREITEFIKDFAIYFIIFIVVFLFFYFIVSFQKVVGDSMNPTYQNNDIVVLSKIGAKVTKIKRNDIIAFNANSGVVYIKRIIAIPGDTIYSKDNKVYVNDKEIKEEYLLEQETSSFKLKDICNIKGCEQNKIPDDYYFVLGDNRNDSVDSRYKIIGLVYKKNIIGKVSFKIFPW